MSSNRLLTNTRIFHKYFSLVSRSLGKNLRWTWCVVVCCVLIDSSHVSPANVVCSEVPLRFGLFGFHFQGYEKFLPTLQPCCRLVKCEVKCVCSIFYKHFDSATTANQPTDLHFLLLCSSLCPLQGIWRIPVDEIDRPGSFASHMNRSIVLLLEVLSQLKDHDTLLKVSFMLQRTPDQGK